ncbi:hypothetical protein R50073_10440 [Maricurvus nonylphenolicus]|uniref:hypothetical protein n=1 Tax=Maricurvus nonylphenolicus TaxID=1008307 RepID=UPI0036F335B3
MEYQGLYTLIFTDSEGQEIREESQVGFSVNRKGMENPGGELRRFAYKAFCDSDASGLSIDEVFAAVGVD